MAVGTATAAAAPTATNAAPAAKLSAAIVIVVPVGRTTRGSRHRRDFAAYLEPRLPVDQETDQRLVERLRRIDGNGFQNQEIINIGNELSVDFAKREVFLSGKRLNLTPIEYNLLATLVKNEGRVLTHSFLLGKVWGLEDDTDFSYIKKYIYRLRSKLNYLGDMSKVILTERGVGYRFIRPTQ